MNGFVDEVFMTVASGSGGNGCISFRREKNVEYGGPDGGDGGRGGRVMFMTKDNLRTLRHLKMRPSFIAKAGQQGMGSRMHGKDGEDVLIYVPLGTSIFDISTGALIKTFDAHLLEPWVFLDGGNGGWGNWHFKGPRNQAPRHANDGLPGKEVEVRIEMTIIADIGFVGFPNAGKSSLLSFLTNANPEVADYPFTTKIPNIGVLNYKQHDIFLADIPGILEGASEGYGLGIRFLKHISRTIGLIFLIDISNENLYEQFKILKNELHKFSEELDDKKYIIVFNKIDLFLEEELVELKSQIKKDFKKEKNILFISLHGHQNLTELKDNIFELFINTSSEKKREAW